VTHTLPTTRDKLLSDWRDRLAAAEAEPNSSAPRRAWLARIRRRLYRFLLSLYGDGNWRAAAPPQPQRTELSPVIFDSPEAESLAGKPAKDAGKIRSVLKSVANGQDYRPVAGSLTAEEVLSNSWLIVASESSSLDVQRCVELLRNERIDCRIVPYHGARAVEVPATSHSQAWMLLRDRKVEVRKPPRVARNSGAPLLLMFMGFCFPTMLLMLALLLASLARGTPPTAEALHIYALAIIGTAIVCCVTVLIARIAEMRGSKARCVSDASGDGALGTVRGDAEDLAA